MAITILEKHDWQSRDSRHVEFPQYFSGLTLSAIFINAGPLMAPYELSGVAGR